MAYPAMKVMVEVICDCSEIWITLFILFLLIFFGGAVFLCAALELAL